MCVCVIARSANRRASPRPKQTARARTRPWLASQPILRRVGVGVRVVQTQVHACLRTYIPSYLPHTLMRTCIHAQACIQEPVLLQDERRHQIRRNENAASALASTATATGEVPALCLCPSVRPLYSYIYGFVSLHIYSNLSISISISIYIYIYISLTHTHTHTCSISQPARIWRPRISTSPRKWRKARTPSLQFLTTCSACGSPRLAALR